MRSNAELDINAFRSAHMRSNAELDINVFRSAHMRSNAELDINVFLLNRILKETDQSEPGSSRAPNE